jgi:LCCL domain
MTHQLAKIVILSAAAFIACDHAAAQSTTTSAPPAAARSVAPAAPPALDLGDCPDVAGSFELGKTYVCSCPPGATDGSPAGTVYGSLVYANDSNICSAAVHAGALKSGAAGRVLLQMLESPPVFKSTTQNGVKSEVWLTATAAAFQFALPARP